MQSIIEEEEETESGKDKTTNGKEEFMEGDTAKEFMLKYTLHEILGSGLCSVVRLCVEKRTSRQYAVKIVDFSHHKAEDEILREETENEISILNILSGHPYIIELHEVFVTPIFIFMVFEICKNGELFDYLTKTVSFSEKKTRTVMKQLLEAVEYIHSRNIVHRDLKLENILLDDKMDIKISDFGFSQAIPSDENLYDILGTPGYLAPEVLKTALLTPTLGYRNEIDMWACGVIMYTLMVGFPPFWHHKEIMMRRNIMEGKYNFSSPKWDNVTDCPKELIKQLLVTDPKKRLTATQALQHDFFKALVKTEPPDEAKRFDARRLFRLRILVVRAAIRIKRLKFTPVVMPVTAIQVDPYRIKILRELIDGCAFQMYSQWVKPGEKQNRAVLFQDMPKHDVVSAKVNDNDKVLDTS